MAGPVSELISAPYVTRGELAVRLTHVLGFVNSNLAVIEQHARFWDSESDFFVRLVDKIAMECALLIELASRIPDPSQRLQELIRTIGEKLAPHVRSQRTQMLLRRYPQTAGTLGAAHVLLSRVGHHDEALDEVVLRYLGEGYAE